MLTAGTKLGPYEVQSTVGAGGMGEVYRATDTRLDRTVAIKVLAGRIAADPQFRERFDREARSIAALNHPHICVLHDVGHQDGVDFLVMEYLEGETLAQRLTRGPLPVDDALAYGVQIADALDKAHRHGIVHRDLKPGNVMLTKAGAKLLDFGLAKISGGAAVQGREAPGGGGASLQAGPTAPPTMTTPLTEQGAILGTFQYMAPEQIEGRDADPRTDIFALGVVLYEMLTARRAFEGKTRASLIAAILGAEPSPLSTLQLLTPPPLERVVRRCLAKDAEDRWQSARDLLEELKWIGEAAPQPSAAAAPARTRERLMWAAALLVATSSVGLGVWISTRPEPPSPRPITRFSLAVPPIATLTGFEQNVLALSPDGTKLVYVAVSPGGQQLYMRSLDQLDAVPVRGTEGATGPFFSPDGAWIGFFAGGKLKKVPASGGAALALADVTGPRGAAWSLDDTIYFTPGGSETLWRVPASGGTPTRVTTRDQKTENSHRWPEVLPGGKAALFTIQRLYGDFNAAAIAVVRLDTGEQRVLVEGGSSPRYVPSGHIVFARAGAILAVPFDLERLEVTGSAAPVIENVSTSVGSGASQMAVSRTGSIAYVPGGEGTFGRLLTWVDRRGTAATVPAPRHAFQEPRLSPDGARVAANIRSGGGGVAGAAGDDVWIYQFARGTLTRFTFGPTSNETPIWSPDGTRVAYASQQPNSRFIFVKPADGSGPEVKVGEKQGHLHVLSWSPRGDVLAVVDTAGAGGADVWLLRTPEQKFEPFLRSPFAERAATFSPDGRWIAYVSNESGRNEVYMQAFPGPGGKWQISTDGGVEPVWARSGLELFYRNGDKMLAVSIEGMAASLNAGTPKLLFEGRYALSGSGEPFYDVTPDGQRFLMLKLDQPETAGAIVVVQEWTQELQRLVPVKKE